MSNKRSKAKASPSEGLAAAAPANAAARAEPAAATARWSPLRLVATAAALGIAIGLLAMVTIDLLLPWSTPINVPAMPLEQLQALTAVERDALMRSGSVKLRAISGYERASYVVRAAPVQLRNNWIAYALVAFVAALLSGWLVRRASRGSNA